MAKDRASASPSLESTTMLVSSSGNQALTAENPEFPPVWNTIRLPATFPVNQPYPYAIDCVSDDCAGTEA